MENAQVIFKPTKKHIVEIKQWLIEERNEINEGFYCNWSAIEDSFDNKKIAVLSLAKQIIGFITWFDSEKVTTIQITEIKPGLRRMGYGRLLMEALFEKLKKQGVMVLDLHCQPAKSEKAWKKMGFKQYPYVEAFNDYNSEDGKYLFRVLVPFLKPTKSLKGNEVIELWSVEPYQVSRFPSEWKWHPKFEKGSRNLAKPIISPVKGDWNIQWKKDGNVIKSAKVKRFSKIEIDFSDFMIIESLPLS